MASIHYTTGREFVRIEEKNALADDDRMIIEDSENNFNKKQAKVSAIKSKVLSGGLDQTITFTDASSVTHTLVFTDGILTSYSTS